MVEQRNISEEEKRIRREEKDVEQVERSLRGCRTDEDYKNLIENILRSKKEHLNAYVNICLGQLAAMRSDLLLPEPFDHDSERVNLRDIWVNAAAITGNIGSYTLRMVRRWGYRDAMLRQLSSIDNIGKRGFVILHQHGCLKYSAEVNMRKYYSDMLSSRQIARIDEVLAEVRYRIE